MERNLKKCLVVGSGSAGSRHARILRELPCDVHLVSRRGSVSPCYSSLHDAFVHEDFQYIVLANETFDHYSALVTLAGLGCSARVLVEKPLFSEPGTVEQFSGMEISVAYNLRFHPIINQIKTILHERRIFSIDVYAGQYLPDWRPGRDYRQGYSASRARGGGVLRDLSHELDYVSWWAGRWRRLTALTGAFGDLEIDSEDTCCLLLETEKCPAVVLHMNYLDRQGRREIIINAEGLSLKADLIANRLDVNGDSKTYAIDRDHTYREQIKAFLAGDRSILCPFEDGYDIVELIAGAEEASVKRKWYEREKRIS